MTALYWFAVCHGAAISLGCMLLLLGWFPLAQWLQAVLVVASSFQTMLLVGLCVEALRHQGCGGGG